MNCEFMLEGRGEKHREGYPGCEWQTYFEHAYHDMYFFFNSITQYDADEYVYFGDLQKNLFYISDNMREDFGFSGNLVENLMGQWENCIHGQMWRDRYVRDLRNIFEKKRDLHDLRYQVEDRDGRIFWVRCCGSVKWNEDRTVPLFFAGRVSKQDETFMVDPVTNFPSCGTLQLHLEERLRSHRPCLTIGLCLNNIFQINTMHGRSLSDQLIGAISRKLMDRMAGKMTFYRLPGVRCIALVDETEESREALVEEMREIIAGEYAKLGNVTATPCSFAVMDFPQPGVAPADFQENMVSLIKIAKREHQLPFIEASEQNIDRVHELTRLELTITQNVLQNMEHFRMVVQPVVSTETGEIIAGEALMRWNYQGKDVSPETFIPLLEKNHMIHLAGRWAFREAVRICTEAVRTVPDYYLTVNISLEQLDDENLLTFIPDTLMEYGLEGRHIVIEMTESCMDKDPERLHTLMEVCSSLGVRFALDDFGTGYSSLRVLLQYPTNIIKLDRSLLLEMTESADKTNFINSIVFACHQFGKKVCMEGVEDENQRYLVQKAQCDMIQGFYYYRPTEVEELYNILEEQTLKQ